MRAISMILVATLGVSFGACQRDERKKKSADPDQILVDQTKTVLGGIFEIINDLDIACPDAATKLAAYEKGSSTELERIAKEYKLVQGLGGDRARRLADGMGKLVGNNTPAFRRFSKRCPAQAAALEKTLEGLGGADAKKLAGAGKHGLGQAGHGEGGGGTAGSETGPAGVPGAAKDGEGDFNVRPPVAADLEGYIADLPGDGKKIMAEIITTMGTFHCEVFADKVPMTAANFIGLSRGLKPFRHPRTGAVEKRPYYDGIIFHRVIPGFMLQTGDPLGQGNGGPGYKFADEFEPSLRHDRAGKLAMANSGPRTNGSQFFITERATEHLDDKHTVFGQCKEVDLIKKIARVKKDPRNNSRPAEPVIIKKIKISRGK